MLITNLLIKHQQIAIVSLGLPILPMIGLDPEIWALVARPATVSTALCMARCRSRSTCTLQTSFWFRFRIHLEWQGISCVSWAVCAWAVGHVVLRGLVLPVDGSIHGSVVEVQGVVVLVHRGLLVIASRVIMVRQKRWTPFLGLYGCVSRAQLSLRQMVMLLAAHLHFLHGIRMLQHRLPLAVNSLPVALRPLVHTLVLMLLNRYMKLILINSYLI